MRTKLFHSLIILNLLLFLGGCAPGTMSKQTGGATLGGILGGALGTQIGGGKGRTAAIVAGTIFGALIGGSIGATMDAVDQQKASMALENSKTDQTVSWTNPNTKVDYQVTPTKTFFQAGNGQPCREYQTLAIVDGKRETLLGAACRRSDGYWQSAGN